MPRQRISIDRGQYSRVPSRYIGMIDQALFDAANYALGVLRKDLSRPYRGNPANPGDPPRKRTGALQASYVLKRVGPGEVHIVAEGPGAKIADIMELGGGPATIRPRYKRALLIPVTVLEARQIGRDLAKKRKDRGKKRRSGSYVKHAGTVKIGGKLFLLRKYARRRAIRPRPHLRPAIQKSTPRMARMVRDAAKKAGRLEMQRLDRALKPLAGPITPFTEAFDNSK